ncbi:helix-turn-helix domain-containing protein [Streptomyces sp. M1013]|uniref:helix-turn-helix domain-containing protein n=1 Tax=Streptomyces sp. M1013 TaxID=549798 RepID=UPI000978EBE2|nr:helix-turn-helix domain-containing protein [Streptomyces sp. M1013]
MLQVEFDQGALARLRVARGSDALWETVLSLQLLRNGQESLTYGPWRREVRDALYRVGLADDVRALMSLCPPTGYFPDFLTPGLGDLGLEDAVGRVLSTPRRRLAAELDRLCAPLRGPVPSSVRWVATGEPAALRRLGDMLRRYHALAVAPYLSVIRARAGQDRARRAEAALAGGAEALLASYAELPGRRRPDPRPARHALPRIPVAAVGRAPADAGARLLLRARPAGPGGRVAAARAGASAGPGARLAPALPGRRGRAVRRAADRHLTGPGAGGAGGTTDDDGPGPALRLAPSTASRHAAVLREAGLVATRREGNRVLHRRTGLGSALLEGQQVGTPGSQASATSMKMLET